MMIIEMPLNPDKKFIDMVERGRKMAEDTLKGKAVFAGWQLHYVVDGILTSFCGYSEGFNQDDYEGK